MIKPDFEYFEFLKSLKGKLGLDDTIEFTGSIPYNKIAGFYKESNLVIGLTPLGGIDKTILEGMASGCLVLTSNTANKKYFGSYFAPHRWHHDKFASLIEETDFNVTFDTTHLAHSGGDIIEFFKKIHQRVPYPLVRFLALDKVIQEARHQKPHR